MPVLRSIAITESLVFTAGPVYELPVPMYNTPFWRSIVGEFHTAAPAGAYCVVPAEFFPTCVGASVIAMDLKTGKIAWWNQVTGGDAFLVNCRPGLENCPKEIGPDHDFGNAPILRTLPGGKRIIVIGQKSGNVWGLDPDAQGKVLWSFKAGKGGALGGIEWGSAADETTAYIPVSDVLTPPNEAGGLFALKLTDGTPIWHTPAPKLECNTGRGCTGAQSAPVSVIPGVVFSGSVDGHMRAFSTKDGSILWDYNTARDYETVNHVPGKGGSIDASGPAIADGLLVTNSGYALWRGLSGNVLLAFSAK